MHSSKHRKTNLLRAVIVASVLISCNFIWFLFFQKDTRISLLHGILTPVIYGLLYYLIKTYRRKIKTKSKPYIFIPIVYSLFGVTWFVICHFFVVVSDSSNTPQQNVEIQSKNSSINPQMIEDNQHLLEKLKLKSYFLYNPNLSYLSLFIEKLDQKSSGGKEHKIQLTESKIKTNQIIIFFNLFIIQCFIIWVAEKKIYPKIKPQFINDSYRKRNRVKYKKLELDDNYLVTHNESKEEDDSKKFPSL